MTTRSEHPVAVASSSRIATAVSGRPFRSPWWACRAQSYATRYRVYASGTGLDSQSWGL